MLESSTRFIANRGRSPAGRVEKGKIDGSWPCCSTERSSAYSRVGLLLNVRRDDLDNVIATLPSLRNPTISQLSDPNWVAINTIVEEKTVRQLIPKLKAARAEGIVEYPLNKVVY